MGHRIVSSRSLGLNCWAAERLAGTCAACRRYETCAYPERIADRAHDETLAQARRLRAESDRLFAETRRINKGARQWGA